MVKIFQQREWAVQAMVPLWELLVCADAGLLVRVCKQGWWTAERWALYCRTMAFLKSGLLSQGSDQQGFLQGYLTFAYPLLDALIWNHSIVQQPNPLCSPLILQALRLSLIPKVKCSHLKHIFVCLVLFFFFLYETLFSGSVEFCVTAI